VNLSLYPSLILVGNQVVVVERLAVDRTRPTRGVALTAEVPSSVG